MSSDRNELIKWMRQALREAEQCRVVSFYGVGCVIVSGANELIASAYTGEKHYMAVGAGGATSSIGHAEEVALEKARDLGSSLAAATLYSTLEPCSERKSQRINCTQLIIESGLKRVVFGAPEPYDSRIDIHCQGARLLAQAGVQVVELNELRAECLQAVLAKR